MGDEILSSIPSLVEKGELKLWVMTTPGRHLGVFPEVAAHWDWFSGLIAQSKTRNQCFESIWIYGPRNSRRGRGRRESNSRGRFEKIGELGA